MKASSRAIRLLQNLSIPEGPKVGQRSSHHLQSVVKDQIDNPPLRCQ